MLLQLVVNISIVHHLFTCINRYIYIDLLVEETGVPGENHRHVASH
jgi:hypothetical protein